MTHLDDFLKQNSFKKYRNGIERIKSDFVQSGYEKFLWKPFMDELSCMQVTTAKTNSFKHKPSVYVTQFIQQFKSHDVIYIFPKRNAPNFFMIQEVCKKSKALYIINNLFPDDETINYAAVFDPSSFEEIALMNHLAYWGYMSDVFGGYKLFNYSLPYYADFCADNGQQYLLQRPNQIMHFCNFCTRHDTNPFIIYDVRKKIEEITKQYYANEFELFMDLNYTLMPFLQQLYQAGIDVENAHPFPEWNSKKDEIKKQLVINGTINSKWKNEESLYLLVQKKFPDAIYQYRPEWLKPQSLDIYIPSLQIAIEYQGRQHYEPVEFFGGETAFYERVELDKRKQKKCIEHNVRLIEWDYNYDINEEHLIARINA